MSSKKREKSKIKSFQEVLDLPKRYLINIPKGRIEKGLKKREEQYSFENTRINNNVERNKLSGKQKKKAYSVRLKRDYFEEGNNSSSPLGFFRRNFSISHASETNERSKHSMINKSYSVSDEVPPIENEISAPQPDSVVPTPPISPNKKASITPERSEYVVKKWASDHSSEKDINDIPSIWLKISYRGSPPTPRCYHSSVIIGNTMCIFGGKDADSIKNQIFTLDLDTYYWVKPQVTGKIPHRYGHTAVSFQNCMFTFGGIGTGEKVLNDFHVLTVHNKTYTWIEIVPPNAEDESNVSFPNRAHDLPLDSLYQSPTGKVVTKSAIWPPALTFHSTCIIDNIIYMIGGTDFQKHSQNSNVIWRYHIYQRYWSSIVISPSLHSCQMLTCFSNVQNREKGIIVIGGKIPKKSIKSPLISSINLNTQRITHLEFSNRETPNTPKMNKLQNRPNDLAQVKLSYSEPSQSIKKKSTLPRNQVILPSASKQLSSQFDRTKLNRIILEGTPPKMLHSHCSFSYLNSFTIIGGLNDSNEISSEIFVYNMDNSKWSTFKEVKDAPPPMFGHTCVRKDDKIVIFGGCTSDRQFSNDCYQLQLFPTDFINNNNNNNNNIHDFLEDADIGRVENEDLRNVNELLPSKKIEEAYVKQLRKCTIPKLRGSVVVVENFIRKISKRDLIYHQKLSTGATSTVYLGKYQFKPVAIKKYNKNEIKAFESEIGILKQTNHNGKIVKCYGIVNDIDEKAIVFEYAELGDLYSYIHKVSQTQESFDFAFVLKIALNIAEGMKFLHDLDILHRDLKSLNILMMSNNINDKVCVKISDFGESKKRSHDLSGGDLGSIRWTAPEILRKEAFKDKSDVYSFGIILWELVSMQVPYADCPRDYLVEERVLEGCRPEFPEDFKNISYKLLASSCWHVNPADRPTFDEVINYLRAMQKGL